MMECWRILVWQGSTGSVGLSGWWPGRDGGDEGDWQLGYDG